MKKDKNASEEYVEIVRSVMKIDRNVLEKYIETIRKAAEAISEITGWEWYENICYPWDETCEKRRYDGRISISSHGNYYYVSFVPKGIKWFDWIIWISCDVEKGCERKKIGRGS